jgi:hypothetical protein
MNKSGFLYLKWTAVVAVLTFAVITGGRPSTATKQPGLPATAVPGVDLANEERTLAKYFEDLVAYNRQAGDIGKRSSFTLADLDPLQRRSDDLKSRLSGLQNVIREIVTKLKAANEWSDLDVTTAAKITDARQKAYIEQESFKQLLEESSNGLTSHANEISLPLDNLRKKLTSRYGDGADVQFVRAAYEAPAPMTFVSLACSVGRIQLGLGHRLHRSASDGLLDTVSCNCNPGAGIGIATGTPCSQVLAK